MIMKQRTDSGYNIFWKVLDHGHVYMSSVSIPDDARYGTLTNVNYITNKIIEI